MIFRSPWPDPHVPDVALHAYVLRHAQLLAARPALVDASDGRTLGYGELALGVRRVAAGLAARGFGRGDVLGLQLPNVPEFAVAFLGALAAGGTVTTLNPLYTEREVAAQLADADARVVVRSPADLPAADGEPPAVALDPRHDVAALPYSSGTSGTAKGVLLTHRALVTNLVQIAAAWPLAAEDRTLGLAPFFHSMGLFSVLCHALASGATVVCIPRLDFEAFLAAVQEHRITCGLVAPPLAQALAAHPAVDRYDLSSLRMLGVGAAPSSAELELACEARIGCRVAQGYGMTEAGPVISMPALRGPGEIRHGSVGRLMPGAELQVIDVETGAALGPGERGELWLRGPSLMAGYHRNPDATAATLDRDGWLHTGDIGAVDGDGHVYVVDRLKELIKYKGFQVAPAELEALLATHPAVRDVAVVGVPDEAAGEVPKAFVVAAGADGDELLAYVAERVAPHKRVRRIELVEAIPKSASGKVLRRVLIERERAAARS